MPVRALTHPPHALTPSRTHPPHAPIRPKGVRGWGACVYLCVCGWLCGVCARLPSGVLIMVRESGASTSPTHRPHIAHTSPTHRPLEITDKMSHLPSLNQRTRGARDL